MPNNSSQNIQLNLLKNKKKLIPSLAVPQLIRLFARSLELISSRLSSLFGLILFTTPIKYNLPKREQYMLKSAQKKRLFIENINKEIEVLSYGYSRKKVLLVHGWCGRSTQLYAFADKLLENGYMVISFDGPAHGKSSGKTTMMPEFLETIKEINRTFGVFEAAIGHSFGATSLYIATSDFLSIKSFIAIGSGDKISDIILNFAKNLGLKKRSAQLIQSRLEKKWNVKVDDSSSSTVAKKINIPVLVVHDVTDGDVPVSCAYEIRKNLKKGSLLITNKLGHTKILRNENVISKSIDFIKQNA